MHKICVTFGNLQVAREWRSNREVHSEIEIGRLLRASWSFALRRIDERIPVVEQDVKKAEYSSVVEAGSPTHSSWRKCLLIIQ